MDTKILQSKTVSATQAQNNFGELSQWVAKENRIVYIHNSRNKTTGTLGLVSEKYIQEAESLKERERRRAAWEKIEEIRLEVTDRVRSKLGRDLTESEVEELLKD